MLGERALRLAFCGRHDEAGPLLRETQEVFRALGDPSRMAKTHQTLAVAPLLRGDLDAARRHAAIVREAFEVAGFIDQPTTVGAWLAILEGPREEAVRLLAAAAARPAVEHAVLEDARPLASRLGLAWPPEGPAAEQDDDDVLLERVEGFLGAGRSSSG